METNRNEQIEALEALLHFNNKLVQNMRILARELSSVRLSDTDQLLKSVTDATNWEIQIMNATMSLLNEGKERINKDSFNENLMAFGNAIQSKNDKEMSLALCKLAGNFEVLGTAAKEVTEAKEVVA